MKKYYTKAYFSQRDNLDLHIANSIRLFCTSNHLSKIADIGCGTGLLVEFLRSHGFEAVGVEKYFSAKKTIIKSSATTLPFRSNSLDLVCAISVIEHLTPSESSKFFRETHRVLKTNGFIFLITPNLASPFRALKDDKWFAYTDPTHIHYFTPETLINNLLAHSFNFFQTRFPIDPTVDFSWHLPSVLRFLPKAIKNLITYLLISSPFSTLRDSFWLAAKKIHEKA
jgi:SAM-dependent methyltransferase